MSGPIERIGFRSDEPAVTHPVLRTMVEAAAQQSTPRLRLDATALRAAWIERREKRRRAVGFAIAAGLGALALASLYGRPAPDATPRPDSADAVAVDTPERVTTPDVEQTPPVTPEVAPAPMLAAAVHVRPEPVDATADYEVTGEWSLSLTEGGLRVEVDEGAPAPVDVALPDGALEIHTGVTIVEVAGTVVTVTVESGSAVRIEADGTRHELRPGHASAASRDAARPTASELAALAEERIAAGDRPAAIKHLSTLVRRYPSSAPARTGLIDLARLLKATGRNDEARCAYRLWLDRNPRAALRGEVERAAQGLGEGPACRGLSPKR